MQSVSIINNYKLRFLFFLLLISFCSIAQENSPFSRYGLGDLYPSQNIVNRAMGGLSAAFSSPRSVNFSNPASYSQFYNVVYDIGITLDTRSLRSTSPVDKYNSANLTPSYVALGLPISLKHKVGLAVGIRPVTRINYNIVEYRRQGADSIVSLYQGDGGLYQGFAGISKQWKNLAIGINTGYLFGRKEISTKTAIADSVNTYKSNSSDNTSYNHAFLTIGLQYTDSLSKTTALTFGASSTLRQNLNAKKTIIRETFTYDVNENPVTIDSIYNSGEQSGHITMPATYTAGLIFNKYVRDKLNNLYNKSSIGVEYETSKWSQYRSYGETDRLINSWQLRVGGQLTPNPMDAKNRWNHITYRAGFYIGKDAVNADGNTLPVYAVTLGAAIPFVPRAYTQSTVLNTAFEMGKRGNSKNNITEGFFKFSVSINLSDRWFVKRKYD